MDQEKLRTMIQFCQTTQCRTRYILEHFGEEVDPDWSCNNCDACDSNAALLAHDAETSRDGDLGTAAAPRSRRGSVSREVAVPD